MDTTIRTEPISSMEPKWKEDFPAGCKFMEGEVDLSSEQAETLQYQFSVSLLESMTDGALDQKKSRRGASSSMGCLERLRALSVACSGSRFSSPFT